MISKAFLKQNYIYLVLGIAVLFFVVQWGYFLFGETPLEQLEIDKVTSSAANEKDLSVLAMSISDAIGGKKREGFVFINEEHLTGSMENMVVAAFSSPPWIKIGTSEIDELAGGAGGLPMGFENLPGEVSEKTETSVDTISLKGRKTIPYIYSGYMLLNGKPRVLIENIETGTSYFRNNGESFIDFTVMEVSSKSLVLYNEKNGERVKLLRDDE